MKTTRYRPLDSADLNGMACNVRVLGRYEYLGRDGRVPMSPWPAT